MTDLRPVTALGGETPARLQAGGHTLREIGDMGLASLALRQGAAEPAPFGLALPGPGQWQAGAEVAAFWTGPGQWMIERPGRADSDIAAELAPLCPGCSVTEQTDAFACFEIAAADGAAMDRLLARLVNLDPARLRPGSAQRTGFEHLPVFVIRRAGDRVAMLGMRSAAGSLWHALARIVTREAAR
ncbi:sarcosine oxidase subunit gamma [Frigidibacter oleivorans]|uniref:sarcosine oxidase subunit gamma n=1 Tax=Frigidibacter oleivorans TaxID=2487129 RepID=UPI000F8EE8B0|nr:sarcosine oxidase subunit gamma [Frigidibacter oleivorans]